ncbi:MAG: hypothetical protein ABFS86_05520 [Planctomycetota bacterium]
MFRTLLIVSLIALISAGCEEPGTPTPGAGPEAPVGEPGGEPGATTGAGEPNAAAGDGGPAVAPNGPPAMTLPVPSEPIPKSRSAWDLAAKKRLPKTEPGAYPGLVNVFRLGDRIISGSEPDGAAALKALADMGVKTILSVDGKAPDAAAAQKLGMRYVHVPIQYRGITESERLRLAKVFRELPGPFYVHCFHGVHRGPAAAAWGRVVLDGVPRQQALSEMRQWCGTSEKYRGLYRDVGKAAAPSDAEVAALAWDFPAKHEFTGFRQAMIEASRAFDHLKALKKIKWKVDPEHPDLSAVNEAKRLRQAFESIGKLPATAKRPSDFRRWNTKSAEYAGKLVSRLERLAAGEKKAREGADAAFGQVRERCDSCHGKYRNRSK